ncbi:MAG: PASTA domain-containing protein [Actinobacteria bacterium]|nr:PASTA domain-containing protein [Actinomycetota bacterium]
MTGEMLADRYRLLGETFSGRFLATYEAEDVSLGTRVEIDAVSSHRDGFPFPPARLGELLEASLRMRGPHVYPLFAWWEDEGCLYAVRAASQGTTLAGLLRQTGSLPPAQVEEIAAAAVQVLCEAYGLGLYYLGLNPHQVFIGARGRVAIARAGYGWMLEEAEPSLLARVSPYRAPESDGGREGTRASDVFALAVMLVEMLPEQALTDRLRALLRRASEPLPQRRPSSPRLILEELQEALGCWHAGGAAWEEGGFSRRQRGPEGPERNMLHDEDARKEKDVPTEWGSGRNVDAPHEEGGYRVGEAASRWEYPLYEGFPPGGRALQGKTDARGSGVFRDGEAFPGWETRREGYTDPGARRGGRRGASREVGHAMGSGESHGAGHGVSQGEGRRAGRGTGHAVDSGDAGLSRGRYGAMRLDRKGFSASERHARSRRPGLLRLLALMLAGGLAAWMAFTAFSAVFRGDGGGGEGETAGETMTIILPDLEGMSEEEAIQALEELGLSYQVREAPSRLWSAGRVIAQEPARGAALPPGEVINLVVSSGPGDTGGASEEGVASGEVAPTLSRGESGPAETAPVASAPDVPASAAAVRGSLEGQAVTANRAPRAVARLSCRSGPAPLYVRMDGSGSYDPDGKIVRYLWRCGDGTVLEGMSAQHVFDSSVVPARFQVILEVVDCDGAADTSAVTVEVY